MLDFAATLVREAGAILLRYYDRTLKVQTKSSEVDLVTEADLASEEFIKERIRAAYPDHGILAEESGGEQTEGDYVWIVDPLDGTNNFSHGFPIFCVTVALQYEQALMLGLTYDPLRDELFCAEQNRGATLNGRTLRVSGTPRLVESLVATGFPYKKATIADNNLAEFSRVAPKVQGIRRAGSAALDLAYVAAGRLDGYWEAHLSPWDWAAGLVLVQEAGGKVTDRGGQPWGMQSKAMVATNGLIHEELLRVVSGR